MGVNLIQHLKEFQGRKVRVYYREAVHSCGPEENPFEGRLAFVGDDFVSVDTGGGCTVPRPLGQFCESRCEKISTLAQIAYQELNSIPCGCF